MAEGSRVNRRIVPTVFIITLIFTGVGAGILWWHTVQSANDQSFLSAAQEQERLAETLARSAADAQGGDRDAFTDLQRARQGLDNSVMTTVSAANDSGDQALTSAAGLFQSHWTTAKADVATILDARDTVVVAQRAADVIAQEMPRFQNKVKDIRDQMNSRNAPGIQMLRAAELGAAAGQAQTDVLTMLTANEDVTTAVAQLQNGEAYMDRVLRGMESGDPSLGLGDAGVTDSAIRSEVAAARQLFQSLGDNLRTVHSAGDILDQVAVARGSLAGAADQLGSDAGLLRQQFYSHAENRLIKPMFAYVAFGLAFLFLLVLGYFWSLTSDTRKGAEILEESERKSQEAILRLLDELGSLADGDLTVHVSVSEDMTGAIADSINYAIEALRDLVVTINDTAVQVDSAAQQTRAITAHLAQASENQAQQITSATQAINSMATSIEQVSANAERSAKVAQQSVDIAHKGGEAVRRTIAGMNTIRETIQETSKRIKRLGESSQEIGDIVELINDIAEQTNILALNASIQASMAGEAGRGFAVVADEVQRLAERAGNATRQIEALVKTIQSDTNEAVSSMERSTSDVVSGAQLAENAGRALDEIEKVSNHIATLVQSISNSARQQAGQAADVSRTMNVIQEITKQTADGTHQTADAVGELVQLAAELRKSVSGFKLPGPQAQMTQAFDATEVPMPMEAEGTGGTGEDEADKLAETTGPMDSGEDVSAEAQA